MVRIIIILVLLCGTAFAKVERLGDVKAIREKIEEKEKEKKENLKLLKTAKEIDKMNNEDIQDYLKTITEILKKVKE